LAEAKMHVMLQLPF